MKTVSQLKPNDVVTLIVGYYSGRENNEEAWIHSVGRKWIKVKTYEDQNNGFLLFNTETLEPKDYQYPRYSCLFLGSLEEYNRQREESNRRDDVRKEITKLLYNIHYLDNLLKVKEFVLKISKEI
jgi:hypothetical protein